MKKISILDAAIASIAFLMVASSSTYAAVVAEIEPNDSKATATPAVLAIGDALTGNTTGSSVVTAGTTSADYFRLTTLVQAPGIYRNRLTLTTTGAAGHVGSIRGLGQIATNTGNSSGPGLPDALALDNTAQSSSATSTPARFNQFYTFGPAASLYYRVAGTTSTTGDYTSTLTQDVVTPTSLGSFPAGSITLTNTQLTSTQDTEVVVYDSALTPIAGYLNDDFLDGTVTQTGGSTLNSLLTRTYTPGTYYVAISNFNLADSQLSPSDEGTANANYLDFPGVMINSSTTAFASIPFSLISGAGTTNFTATKPGAFDVYWATFTITAVPEPTSLMTLGGMAVLGLRRRAR
jgi:hypothetical protein